MTTKMFIDLSEDIEALDAAESCVLRLHPIIEQANEHLGKFSLKLKLDLGNIETDEKTEPKQ